MSCAELSPGLLELEVARERLLASARSLSTSLPYPLEEALGRVLAEPVVARFAMPSVDNSAMDGFALRLDELGLAGLPLSQRIPAGCSPEPLIEGSCARIFTGAPIPQGADCVVPQERCRVDEQGRVHVLGKATIGANIRRRGEEYAEGEPLLVAGQVLDPVALALLASQGLISVNVRQRLRVALLSTGDELVDPGTTLAPGQLYDSNRTMLRGLLQQQGCDIVDLGTIPDTIEALRTVFCRARDCADVVICTGGVSVGEEDHVRPVLAELGELVFHGVAIKPGKPFAFGFLGEKPLLGLPGNPVAVLVTWQLLGLPFVQACPGRALRPLQQFPVVAGFSRRAIQQRCEFLRVGVEHGVARLAGGQGSAMLGTACHADGYLMVASDTAILEGHEYAFLPAAQFAA